LGAQDARQMVRLFSRQGRPTGAEAFHHESSPRHRSPQQTRQTGEESRAFLAATLLRQGFGGQAAWDVSLPL